MMGPIDQEMAAIEKTVCYSWTVSWGWGMKAGHTPQATQGSTRASQETGGVRGKHGEEPVLGFLQEYDTCRVQVLIGLIGSRFKGRLGGAGEGQFQESASPQDVKASESHSFIQCCKWQEPPFPWGLLKALHKCLIVTGLWVDPRPSWESLCALTAHSVWVKFTFLPLTPTLGWQILQWTLAKTSRKWWNSLSFIWEPWARAVLSIESESEKQTWKGFKALKYLLYCTRMIHDYLVGKRRRYLERNMH